ncbi:MAG: hypothetical protein KJ880_00220 [Candidatus Omnitrophica bacterium]|nr:hypothetical protein [Candidatus Omnitrophota bacterium]MBU1870444.1 hypothetical protein [Candidatus Omnitrophota bacterium]
MIQKPSYSERGRLGALRRYALYGNPGTPEGRIKGGKRGCEFFRLHPGLARKSGFVIRKEIKTPLRSSELAAFIGIMLGDGSIRSKYQFTISFNYKTDHEYAEYVARLIKRMFAVDYTILRRKGCLGADIIVSSASAVDFLLSQGLKVGNKIKNQVDIPEWVMDNPGFRKACLRGLFDTDGSLYAHRYKVNNRWYEYLKLDFTSCSKPLLHSAHKILSRLGIRSYLKGVHISISAQAEVNKYLATVGSSNSKFLYKWQKLDYWRSG